MKKGIISIRNNTLDIDKDKDGYTIADKNIDIIIHAKTIRLGTYEWKDKTTPTWLYLENEGKYIGSIWIESQTDANNLKILMEA